MTFTDAAGDHHASPGQWLTKHEQEEFEKDPEYIAEGLALRIIEQALELMQEKNISRAELASLMGVSRAYVSRMFNAPPNLTLRSIAHLSLTLGTIPHASLFPNCIPTADEPSLEDKNWLQADLSDYDSLEPYDWGENGPPHGHPVRYIPNVGLVVEDQS